MPPPFTILKRETPKGPLTQPNHQTSSSSLPNKNLDDEMLDRGAAERKVFVGRLNSACTTEYHLKAELFGAYSVETTTIPTHMHTPQTYAFVTLATKKEAEDAIATLNGTVLLDQRVVVSRPRFRGIGSIGFGQRDGNKGTGKVSMMSLSTEIAPETLKGSAMTAFPKQIHAAPVRVYSPFAVDSYHGRKTPGYKNNQNDKQMNILRGNHSKGTAKQHTPSQKADGGGKWNHRQGENLGYGALKDVGKDDMNKDRRGAADPKVLIERDAARETAVRAPHLRGKNETGRAGGGEGLKSKWGSKGMVNRRATIKPGSTVFEPGEAVAKENTLPNTGDV